MAARGTVPVHAFFMILGIVRLHNTRSYSIQLAPTPKSRLVDAQDVGGFLQRRRGGQNTSDMLFFDARERAQETLTECIDPTTQLPLDPTNPLLANVPDSARPCWYLYYDADRTTGCPNAFTNQRITVLRPSTAPLAPPGTLLALTCLTCPASDQICPALGSGS